MTNTLDPIGKSDRLERFLGYLNRDPQNLSLLADAAIVAFEERDFVLAADLLLRIEMQEPLAPPMLNLSGMVALAEQRFKDATTIFEDLIAQEPERPELRFNLAWALAMTDRFEEANDLLDDAVIATSSRGPALKVQMLHHIDDLETALKVGERLAELYPENQALMGALATLAMDAEETQLARAYAKRAGDCAEGLAAFGMFALDEQDNEQARSLFDQAIAQQPLNPRAWMGRGLSLLVGEDREGALEAIDRAAELFETHIGSWIASGWAHFLSGDQAGAKTSFERARALDANFSEVYGGLAVLAITAGDIDSAERNSELALKLDRASFGGILARTMLLNRSGSHEKATRLVEIALSTPVDAEGRTVAQALVRMGYKV